MPKGSGRCGRHGNHAKGEACARSKLKNKEVILIRELRGRMTQAWIARAFLTSPTNVAHIQNRRTWKHL